jgi:hypothetical protein
MINNTEVDYNGHQPEDKYAEAQEKVKKVKDYNHLMIYILVNIFIFFLNVNDLKPRKLL